MMKPLEYNIGKNELLMKTRNISFDDFIYYINNGKYKVLKNKNYPNQKIFLIEHK